MRKVALSLMLAASMAATTLGSTAVLHQTQPQLSLRAIPIAMH